MEKASKNLSSDIQSQLKYFEKSIQDWADVVKVLSRINETLQAYPVGTQLLCFQEFMQRLGQCMSPQLPGVHPSVLTIYSSLIRLFGPNLAQNLDELFVPLLPMYQFASIPTKKQFLLLIKQLLGLGIDQIYIGPIVACLLSCQPADADEQAFIKGLLEQFETSFQEVFVKSLFQLLQHSCEARQNVLSYILILLKKYLEKQWDLSSFDGNEQYLLIVLDSDIDQEIRLTLDIVALLYPVPAVYTEEIFVLFTSFTKKLLLLLQRDQTIQNRVEQWLFSQEPQVYSRLILHSIQREFVLKQNQQKLTKILFQEIKRKEELLDAFLQAVPTMINEVFTQIDSDQLAEFLENEEFVKLYLYRAVAMQLVDGCVKIEVIDNKLTVNRQKLKPDEQLNLIQNVHKITPSLPNLRQVKIHATSNSDAVDVFEGKMYKTDSSGSVVVGELIGIVMVKYIETYSETCLELILELFQKADPQQVAKLLEKAACESEIMYSVNCKSVFAQLCQEICTNERLLFNSKLISILLIIAQNSDMIVKDQVWLQKVLQICVDTKNQDKYTFTEREYCMDLLFELMNGISPIQSQIEHYVENIDGFAESFVESLFEQINELHIEAAEWLCKFCTINNQIFLQKIESIIALKLYNKKEQTSTIQKFIVLWQTAAEKYHQQKLFKRLTLLHIDMYSRVDIDEETRLVLGSFIQRVFMISQWAAELIDNLLDQLGGVSEIINVNNEYSMKNKEIDQNKVQYIFHLLNLLVRINKDSLLDTLISAEMSRLAFNYLPPLIFYKEQYKSKTYLDLLLDLSMCYIIDNDNLSQHVLGSISEFMQQIFMLLKQQMSRSKQILTLTKSICNRISNVLLKCIVQVSNISQVQQIFQSILDTAAHMMLIQNEQCVIGKISQGEIIQLPSIFVEFMQKPYLSHFLQSLKNKQVHSVTFIMQIINILSTLKSQLSVADVNCYVKTWIDADIQIQKIPPTISKQLPCEISDQNGLDQLSNELDKKADAICQKIKSGVKNEQLQKITKNSFIPAPFKFYPAAFICIQVLEGVYETAQSQLSADYAYALSSLILRCTEIICKSSYVPQIVAHQIVETETDQLQLQQFFDKKKSDESVPADQTISFCLPVILTSAVKILANMDQGTYSITQKILQNLVSTVSVLGKYSPLIFTISLVQLLKESEDQRGLVQLISRSSFTAPEYLKSICHINFFKQKTLDLTQIKLLQSNNYLHIFCQGSYATFSTFLTILNQVSDRDLLKPVLIRTQFQKDSAQKSMIALIQLHHSRSASYSGSFNNFVPNDQFVPAEQMQLIFSIEQLQHIGQLVQLIMDPHDLDTFEQDDALTVKRFISRLSNTLFTSLENQIDSIPAKLLDDIFSTTLGLAALLCRQPNGKHIQQFSSSQDVSMQKITGVHQDLAHLQNTIPHLLQLALSCPRARSNIFRVLSVFKLLEFSLKQKVFQKPVQNLVKQLNLFDPSEICQIGEYLSYVDIQELIIVYKKQTAVLRALVILFSSQKLTDEFEVLLSEVCAQARQPDQQLSNTINLLNAILISQPAEMIRPAWTNIVQFIIAAQKVVDMGLSITLLGQKCPEKQIYVGFLKPKVVEDPKLEVLKMILKNW
ncbi:Conserved_hypothetical protein [Hexamita inflata]|uniref:Dopey N-terminal domain-containing protein n=1 Tax=Hexamita inflata TaxID=28002 RepID=A0ABP1HB98_9EUKA